MKYYTQRFDTAYGGFGTAPKFPTPVNLVFLLQLAGTQAVSVSEESIFAARLMASWTLKMMALGGIHGIRS